MSKRALLVVLTVLFSFLTACSSDMKKTTVTVQSEEGAPPAVIEVQE